MSVANRITLRTNCRKRIHKVDGVNALSDCCKARFDLSHESISSSNWSMYAIVENDACRSLKSATTHACRTVENFHCKHRLEFVPISIDRKQSCISYDCYDCKGISIPCHCCTHYTKNISIHVFILFPYLLMVSSVNSFMYIETNWIWRKFIDIILMSDGIIKDLIIITRCSRSNLIMINL